MAKKEASFGSSEAATGIQALSRAQVINVLKDQQEKHGAERGFTGIQRMARIENRAKLGNVKHFISSWNSEVYPEGADGDDKTTWLGPGETMLVPIGAALHFCGNFLAEKPDDGEAIIAHYGGYEYEGVPLHGMAGGPPPVNRIGPPPLFPDLVVVQIDQRGKEFGPTVAIYERYLGGKRYSPRQRPDTVERDKEQLGDLIATVS